MNKHSLKQHRQRVKKIHRLIFWAAVAGIIAFTGHELAAKACEFILASLLDVIIQWE